MTDIQYVQLDSSDFLTDIDFQMMDAEQRGVYCSIILYLYCNEGRIELNNADGITLLDTRTSKLSQMSGCRKTGTAWDTLWAKIAHKFQITGNMLSHKRVSAEIQRAQKLFKSRSHRGSKHPNWKGGPKCPSEQRKQIRNRAEYSRWRKAVYQRDNYTCRYCGERGGRLEAHHKKQFSECPNGRFDVDNGETLCEACHKQLHKEKRKCLKVG